MSRARFLVVAALCVASTAVPVTTATADDGRRDERPYTISNPPLPPLTVDGVPSTVRQGVQRGAAYIIEVPPEWNGELVMWAHGYRGNGTVLTVDPPGYGLRQRLLDQGYAWAASSYDAQRLRRRVRRADARATWRDLVRPARRPSAADVHRRRVDGRPRHRPLARAVPVALRRRAAAVRRDRRRELFDFFLDYTLVAQALAGVDAYPIPADYADAPWSRGSRRRSASAGIAPAGHRRTRSGMQFRDDHGRAVRRSAARRRRRVRVWKDFLFTLPTPRHGGRPPATPGASARTCSPVYAPNAPGRRQRARAAGRRRRTAAPGVRSRSPRSPLDRGPAERPGAVACTTSATCSCRSRWSSTTPPTSPPRPRPSCSCSGRSGPSATASSPRPRSAPRGTTSSLGRGRGATGRRRRHRRRRRGGGRLRVPLQRPGGMAHRDPPPLPRLLARTGDGDGAQPVDASASSPSVAVRAGVVDQRRHAVVRDPELLVVVIVLRVARRIVRWAHRAGVARTVRCR